MDFNMGLGVLMARARLDFGQAWAFVLELRPGWTSYFGLFNRWARLGLSCREPKFGPIEI